MKIEVEIKDLDLFQEVIKVMREMLEALPKHKQEEFAEKVQRIVEEAEAGRDKKDAQQEVTREWREEVKRRGYK